MDRVPQTRVGDIVSFKFGEVIYRCTVYDGKIVKVNKEDKVSTDTTRNDILKDLMSIAAETVDGKDIEITIKSDEQGPYRIVKRVITKSRGGRVSPK